jgi:hypothetical protein
MKTTTLQSVAWSRMGWKSYGVATLFVLGSLMLTQLCHLLPQGGAMLLPLYFFTLLATSCYGWGMGLSVAMIAPLVNALLFGMPMWAMLPVILTKSIALALLAGYLYAHQRQTSLLWLTWAVASSQGVGMLLEWAMSGSLWVALQDVRVGLPGIALQIIGCKWIVRYIQRA